VLLIDGARYERWTPPNEAALEEIVKEHADDIFGSGSVYLDLKHKLHGSEIATIPDGYAITLDPDKLWIVEVELATHDVYHHVIPQLMKFMVAVKKPSSRDRLRDVLVDEIDSRSPLKERLSSKGELYKFVSQLVAKPPEILVIVDNWVSGLDDILEAPIDGNIVIREFATFCHQSKDPAEHAHQVEPVHTPAQDYKTLWQTMLDGVAGRGIPVKRHANERHYQAIPTGMASVHFEWLLHPRALNVELHFERADRSENKSFLEVFRKRQSEIEKKLGEKLHFDQSFHKKWTRLYTERPTAESDNPPRIGDDVRLWGIETMAKLYHACRTILDDLDA